MTGNLTLHLKKEYFEQIADGTKTEEYRIRTPYWIKRLEGRTYDNIILLCGYPSRYDTDKRLILPWRGCFRSTILHPHFGPEPVDVYVVRVGGGSG